MEWSHKKCRDGGRNLRLNGTKIGGLWIINFMSTARSVTHQCVTCRKLKGQFETQKMADRPEERTDNSPPFTHVGLDMFETFLAKSGRKEIKHV